MTSLVQHWRTWLVRRLFSAARWLDRRDPRWLAVVDPQTKRRLFGRVWRRLAAGLPEVHRLSGFELRVPSSMHPIYVVQSYEPATSKLIADLLRPGQTAVDVGANLGYLTAVMARAVGPKGRVWAVEPDPENLRLLAENLARNGLSDRVEIIAAAAGRRDEVRRLYRQSVGARNTLHAGEVPRDAAPVEVRALRLDQAIHGRVDLIKIDVEGSEIEALDGLAGCLAAHPRPQLVVEWCPQAALRAGDDAAELPRRLGRLGYRLRLVPECAGPTDLDEAMALVESGVLRDGWYGNLHAAPALEPERSSHDGRGT